MKLIFLGIQGSGKGTQGKILKNEYGFDIFETGGALRKLAKEESELGKRIKNTIENGNLVDINTIGEIIQDYLKKAENNSNIIFDGIPRNQEQKDLFDSLVSDFKIVVFELSKQKAEKRLLGRKYNSKTGETFLSTFNYDPTTGDKLEVRKDDNQESIKQRIENFYDKTLPIIEKYEKEGKLIKINADNCIEGVTKELIEKLGL